MRPGTLDDHWRGIAIQLIEEHMDSPTIARKLECAVAEITALRETIRAEQAEKARVELLKLYGQGKSIKECVASMRARGVPAAPGADLARHWVDGAGVMRRRESYDDADRALYLRLRRQLPRESHAQLVTRWTAVTGRHLERNTGQAWVAKASATKAA